ncbi:MAG TPA: DUF1614 domain-containing protein [Candidatus Binataceae bacterium]|jgi:uncharacterized membrane protein|nr:DUF1614 domain-containing protein [Candidatus Binataceae bacterium]
MPVVFFAPFLFFYFVIFFLVLALLFALIEIHIINFAFQAVGLPPELAFVALLASLIGSYINVPIVRLKCDRVHDVDIIHKFGVAYRIPIHLIGDSTTIAVNVGGAMVPILISIYALTLKPEALFPALAGAGVVAIVVHVFARPVRGIGIAVPMFIPPIVAALASLVLVSYELQPVVAYVSGVAGTLIGADLANLRGIRNLGAPVASIGGAGTFDGIFLTGIVAVLLA